MKYISLVNLIAGREVVPELVANTFTVDNIAAHLGSLLDEDSEARKWQIKGYAEVQARLGNKKAADNAARIMIDKLKA